MEPRLSDELIRRARQLAETLAERGIEHVFIGGLAVNTWAIPLPTYGIDLCIALAPGDVPSFVQALEPLGFIPPETTWIESVGKERFQEFTVHWPHGVGVRAADVFLATDPFQRQVLARRREVELEAGFRTSVATPEDLLVYKLVAYRPKDRAAIERILAIQGDLDWSYVRHWVERFGVKARLSESLREAGLSEPPS